MGGGGGGGGVIEIDAILEVTFIDLRSSPWSCSLRKVEFKFH